MEGKRIDVPRGIVDELQKLVDKVPQKTLLDYTKRHPETAPGFPIAPRSDPMFRLRIKQTIKSPLDLDRIPHHILREADLNLSFISVLSEEAIKQCFESLLANFGADRFLANLLVDQRENIRQIAANYISQNNWKNQSLLSQKEGEAAIKKDLGPFFGHIAPFIDIARVEDGRKIDANEELIRELEEAKLQLKEAKVAYEKLQHKYRDKNDKIGRSNDEVFALKKELAKSTQEISNLAKRLSEKDNEKILGNEGTPCQIKKEEYLQLCKDTNQIEQEIASLKKEKKYLEKSVLEDSKLLEILRECKYETCRYKHDFEQKINEEEKKIMDLANERKFHFFMCFRGNYYIDSHASKTVIDAHNDIIKVNLKKYVWWGKFYKELTDNGEEKTLEPFGESLTIDQHYSVATTIRNNVMERIKNGENVYLFNYSPNPDLMELYKCNIIDVWFGRNGIPPSDGGIYSTPECAKFPEYYFIEEKKGDCQKCRKRESGKCDLRFVINFWFKLNKIDKVDDPISEFKALVNCYTNDSINLAIPILYPLLVFIEEKLTPAQILHKKNFRSMYIITHNPNSVDRIKDWLKSNDLKIDHHILKNVNDRRFLESIQDKTYLGDILVYEYAKGRHLWDHFDKSSIENKLFKKHLQGNNVSSIITQLEKWVEEK